MKAKLIILAACALTIAATVYALQAVNSTSMQVETVPNPLAGWQNPDMVRAQASGLYLSPIYASACATNSTRLATWWTNNGNGTASQLVTDMTLTDYAAMLATIASNAAAQAASNAIIAAIAWTNAMTNAWLSAPVKQAAQDFRTVWTNYTSLGPITNPTITYQAAIPLFMKQGTNVTQKQISDCLLWEWSYSQMSSFLNRYFPATDGTNTWPNIQKAPWSILP